MAGVEIPSFLHQFSILYVITITNGFIPKSIELTIVIKSIFSFDAL
jgi:hypothetical protein